MPRVQTLAGRQVDGRIAGHDTSVEVGDLDGDDDAEDDADIGPREEPPTLHPRQSAGSVAAARVRPAANRASLGGQNAGASPANMRASQSKFTTGDPHTIV